MEHSRISRDELFNEIVKLVARRSTCPRKAVGALIVRDGRIASIGYNGSPPNTKHCTEAGCILGDDGGCIRTIHAEQNAIAWAARRGIEINGATLFTTISPCVACSKLIISSGIIEVRFIEQYRDDRGISLLTSAGIQILRSVNEALKGS